MCHIAHMRTINYMIIQEHLLKLPFISPWKGVQEHLLKVPFISPWKRGIALHSTNLNCYDV